MDLSELRKAVEEVELVDGHAHNLVALHSNLPFIHAFSEAQGEALASAQHSLSFKRNLKDLAELYGCESSLRGVEEFRRVSGLEFTCSTCFKAARISAILMDDGLELDKEHDVEWHKSFAPFVGRILRIEKVAEKILDDYFPDGSCWTLDSFTKAFVSKLKSLAGEIFGLKSIAAYRSGLKINTNVTQQEAEEGLTQVLLAGKPIRIANKNLIDYIFLQSLEVAQSYDLPMQIHTGFGDKDLDTRLSNPLHLRSVFEDKRYSKSRIVLLHASYPFSREASYLASVYSQVYLDFGLAIPKLSVHGMISSLKELLDLAPISKVGITDGYAFPETFYLGAKKSREVVFSVLRDTCIDGDLSVSEAVEAAKDILARNAINFYKINLSNNAVSSHNILPLNVIDDLESDVSFVRIIWVDNSGQQRCRAVPKRRFNDVVTKNGVGLAFAVMGMPSFFDGPAPGSGLGSVGEARLTPDLSTIRTIPWSKQDEMVLGDLYVKPGQAWEICPREALKRASKILKDEFDLVMNAGFENEFFLLKSLTREGKEEWIPFESSPYSSSSAFDAASTILREVASALHSMGIPVEQLHAEAGDGQFELVLGYTVCGKAADNLVYTRETVRSIARKHGLLATFVPKYTSDYDLGSGCHVHLSLWQNGRNVFMASDESSKYGISTLGEEFMAGVLHHLPSILPFLVPLPIGYDRLQPNTWSGAYLFWGNENKEAPVRAASPPGTRNGFTSNFEVKSLDGSANPYLGLAAIIAAGIDGLRKHLSLPEPIDTDPNPENLQRLPQSLSESLEALDKADFLEEFIGVKLLTTIKAIRKAENDHYLENKEAFKQLIHRY
ncbi:protein fluG-like [Vicia villosa]|uniref:protein fluG-like n=1 Tax=Vicia villosa TaxID=3911 RepID=UPI00273BF93B|nr:protein fluG-like [Vicia villosa]